MLKYICVLCGTVLQLHASDMHSLQRERVWDALHIYQDELLECLDDAAAVAMAIESDQQSKESWSAISNARFFARVIRDIQHRLHNDESSADAYRASCKVALQPLMCGKYGRGSRDWQEDNDKYNDGDDTIDSDDLRDIDGRGYEDSRDGGVGR